MNGLRVESAAESFSSVAEQTTIPTRLFLLNCWDGYCCEGYCWKGCL